MGGTPCCSGPEPCGAQRPTKRTIMFPSHGHAQVLGMHRFQHHNSPSDKARDTASVRVLAASFKKMRLMCVFTVSGEISRARAMCLLEKPWLIIASTSHSRAVSISVTPLPGCAEAPLASWASNQESRLPTNGGTSRSLDRGTSVPGIKVTSFGAGLTDLFLSVQTKVSMSVGEPRSTRKSVTMRTK